MWKNSKSKSKTRNSNGILIALCSLLLENSENDSNDFDEVEKWEGAAERCRFAVISCISAEES
jgi:hypothetical protein